MKTNSPISTESRPAENEAALRTIIRLNIQVLGITLGLLCAFGIFAATNILLLKGGPNVGAHLQLLGQFFYGFKVTFLGSLVGAVYGFILGYIVGAVIAIVYNWVDSIRSL